MVDNVIPNGDGVYEWNINFGRTKETVKLIAVGDKRSKKERPYVYIYGQEADKSASALHNTSAVITVVRYDFIATQLHRLLSRINRSFSENPDEPFEIVLSWVFTIDFETAKAYRKRHGNYLRESQWKNITVEVRVS